MSDTSRPNPLSTVASKVGTAWAGVTGLLSALVAFGVLTSVQGNAVAAVGEAAPGTITALGTVIAGVLPIVSGLVSAFSTAKAGREVVTPVEDPRAADGTKLIRAAGQQ